MYHPSLIKPSIKGKRAKAVGVCHEYQSKEREMSKKKNIQGTLFCDNFHHIHIICNSDGQGMNWKIRGSERMIKNQIRNEKKLDSIRFQVKRIS